MYHQSISVKPGVHWQADHDMLDFLKLIYLQHQYVCVCIDVSMHAWCIYSDA